VPVILPFTAIQSDNLPSTPPPWSSASHYYWPPWESRSGASRFLLRLARSSYFAKGRATLRLCLLTKRPSIAECNLLIGQVPNFEN
jgi:hypothetical protein